MRKLMMSLGCVAVFVMCAGSVAFASTPQGQNAPPDYNNDQGEPPPPPHGGTQYNDPPPPQQPVRNRRRRVRKKRNYANDFRPIMAISLVHFGNGDAMPVTQSLGIVAALKILQPLQLEVGASFFDVSYSFFGNAGASWAIFNHRGRSGAGVEMRAGFLGGYRFLQIDDAFGLDNFHGITASATLEFNIWLAPRLGLHFQVAGGMGFWVARTDNQTPFAFPEFRSSMGIIF